MGHLATRILSLSLGHDHRHMVTTGVCNKLLYHFYQPQDTAVKFCNFVKDYITKACVATQLLILSARALSQTIIYIYMCVCKEKKEKVAQHWDPYFVIKKYI